MFLSFIIPVYNCEEYVAANLEVIMATGLEPHDFEVVLIDDGSSDGSKAICEQFAGRHQNVHLYQSDRNGPATARNIGLEHATGDYVWFVDADDKIDAAIVPQLKSCVEADDRLELIAFSYLSEYPDKTTQTRMVSEVRQCTGVDFLQMEQGGSFLWNKIYRREAIGTRRFIDGVRHIEDYCFNLQVIADLRHVAVLPDVGYCYNRKNLNSISHGRRLRDRVKANDDSYVVYTSLHQEMRETESNEKRNYLYKELNFSVAAHLYTMLRFDNIRTLRRYIRLYKEMGYYPLRRTGKRKSDLFVMVANHEGFLVFLKKCFSGLRN